MSRYFNNFDALNDSSYLEHHGVLGMKWGVRKYKNADGSYNKKGVKRYGTKGKRTRRQAQNYLNDLSEERNNQFRTARAKYLKQWAHSTRNLPVRKNAKTFKESDYTQDPNYLKVKDEQIRAAKEIAKKYNVSIRPKYYSQDSGSRTMAALGGAVTLTLLATGNTSIAAPLAAFTAFNTRKMRREELNDWTSNVEPRFKVRKKKESKNE